MVDWFLVLALIKQCIHYVSGVFRIFPRFFVGEDFATVSLFSVFSNPFFGVMHLKYSFEVINIFDFWV